MAEFSDFHQMEKRYPMIQLWSSAGIVDLSDYIDKEFKSEINSRFNISETKIISINTENISGRVKYLNSGS